MLWYWTIFVAFIAVSAVMKATGVIDLPGLARWPGWVVMGLVLLGPGWMGFDGGRALIVGEYITPVKGPRAGQIGSWSPLARGVGIDPRSALMKSILLAYGLASAAAMLTYLSSASWGPSAVVAAAALGLWYWPFVTVINIVVIVLVISA